MREASVSYTVGLELINFGLSTRGWAAMASSSLKADLLAWHWNQFTTNGLRFSQVEPAKPLNMIQTLLVVWLLSSIWKDLITNAKKKKKGGGGFIASNVDMK